jgi:uncharacterized alkaline shock family protein YloU
LSGDQTVELEYYDGIDEISEKIQSSVFEAYITLEGVFQGVTRIIGDEIVGIFKELIDKSRGKCIYNRVSLRRNDGSWDEISVLVCNGIAIAAAGEINGERVLGSKALRQLAIYINKNIYTAGVIEVTELSADFVKKRLGIDVSKLGRVEAIEERKSEKPAASPKHKEIEELVSEKEIAPATTIPVETSISKTAPLPISEAKKFLPPHLLPVISTLRETREVIEERKIKPVKISEALQIDKSVLEFSDRVVKYAFDNRISISQIIVRGEPKNLEIEVTVTRLGLTRKREKMINLANNIADLMEDIFAKNNTSLNRLTVVVRHGYDAVKVSREYS